MSIDQSKKYHYKVFALPGEPGIGIISKHYSTMEPVQIGDHIRIYDEDNTPHYTTYQVMDREHVKDSVRSVYLEVKRI